MGEKVIKGIYTSCDIHSLSHLLWPVMGRAGAQAQSNPWPSSLNTLSALWDLTSPHIPFAWVIIKDTYLLRPSTRCAQGLFLFKTVISGRKRTLYSGIFDICCFQRFTWLIASFMFSAFPLLHLYKLLFSKCDKAVKDHMTFWHLPQFNMSS